MQNVDRCMFIHSIVIPSAAHSLTWSSMNPATTSALSAQMELVESGRKMNEIFTHALSLIIYSFSLYSFEYSNNKQYRFINTGPDTIAASDAALCLIYVAPLSDPARIIPRYYILIITRYASSLLLDR